MFMGVARDFLGVVTSGRRAPCTVTDGVLVLECVEAARESSKTESTVRLKQR
jgi:predicted dehydrogenase